MDNTNVKIAIYVGRGFVQGTEAFKIEIGKKIQKILTDMERIFSKRDFERQIMEPELAMLTIAGVDFMLFQSKK